MPAIPVGMRARVGAFVRAWVSLWVSAYPRAYVCAYVRAFVRAYVVRPIQAKKPYDPQKRLKFGLILPYWYKTTKTDYKPK